MEENKKPMGEDNLHHRLSYFCDTDKLTGHTLINFLYSFPVDDLKEILYILWS